MRYRPVALLLLAGISLIGGPRGGFAADPIEKTKLYLETAKDCHSVELSNWSHPTKSVLKKSDVSLSKLELCNGGKYPIYTVRFKYDPRGDTTKYFHNLFVHMISANGFWPLSFVDIDDRVIVDLVVKSKSQIDVVYEDYSADGVDPVVR